jgi:hypothetical protein
MIVKEEQMELFTGAPTTFVFANGSLAKDDEGFGVMPMAETMSNVVRGCGQLVNAARFQSCLSRLKSSPSYSFWCQALSHRQRPMASRQLYTFNDAIENSI